MGHVHGEDRVQVEVGADHPGAPEADLLLHRGDGDDGRTRSRLGRPPERLGGHPDPGPVVDVAGGQPRPVQFAWRGGDGQRVANRDEFAGPRLVVGPDIHALLGDRWNALVVPVTQVDGRLCDHPWNRPVLGVDGDLLSPGDRPVGGPDPREFEEPVVGDIAHGVADLVGVPRHRDGRLDIGFALGDRDGVPVVVDRRLVGARFDGVQPPPLDGGLVS